MEESQMFKCFSGKKSLFLLIIIIAVSFSFSMIKPAFSQADIITLFINSATLANIEITENIPPFVARTRMMQINPLALHHFKWTREQKDPLILNLFEDTNLIAEISSLEKTITGGILLKGVIQGAEYSEVTLAFQDDVLSGSIAYDDQYFTLNSDANRLVEIKEINQHGFPVELQPIIPDSHFLEGTITEGNNHESASMLSDSSDQIDVMVVYTATARASMGSTAAMLNLINLAVSESNTGLANSQVNTSFVLVHTQEYSYSETDFSNMLNDLTYQRGTVLDGVHNLRNQHTADLVVLLVQNTTYCGIGWLMSNPSVNFESHGFSVVSISCATGYYSFAHEIGHNMGSHHNREDAGSTPAYDFSYGYRNQTANFRTIMSYNCPSGCTRVNFWSNPNLSFNGVPMGIDINQTNSAYNALSLNQTAPYVANFRQRTINLPPIPTGVAASDGTYTDKVRVTWGGSGSFDYKIFLPLILKGGSGPTPEAPYFQVYRNTTNSSAGATKLVDHHPASPYDDTSAAVGTTYYYWVKACNSAGCSDFSASDTGYRAGAVTIPSPPTGVSASDGSYTDKVLVSWAASTGATYYQVFRNTTNSSAGATSLTSSHSSSPYDDTSAAVGTTYYYWVKACNSGGCSGFSASDSGYRASEVTTPSPPTGVSASDGTYSDKVQIAWTASAGATYYQVFRYTSNNSSSATSLTSSHSSSPYDDTSAAVGTTYYYWVKACNSGGCSGFSASDSGYRASEVTTPSPPTGVSASDGTYTDKVQVSWAASAGATYYQVFRNTTNSSAGATSLTSSHSSSPYNDTSAVAGTTYYYWVKACNSAGCSGFSASDSGFRQEASGGFNSQFDGHADGWVSHSGTWYIDSEMEVLWTEGIEGTASSVSYTTDFDNFDYQVKLGRLGSDTSTNRIYVRGTPSPLLSGNRWSSGYSFQYSRNGSFSIFKFMPNGDSVQIQGWTSSSAIYQGDYYNILRVVANGSDFSFYINGTLVWQGSDTSFSTGRVGIGMYRAASTGLTEQLVVDWAVLTTIGAGDSGSIEPILPDPEIIIEMNIDGDGNQLIVP
jgi:hypothetical protein